MKRSDILNTIDHHKLLRLIDLIEYGYYDFWLTHQQKDIIIHFLKNDLTYRELAGKHKLSRERIRQIGAGKSFRLINGYCKLYSRFATLLNANLHDIKILQELENLAKFSVMEYWVSESLSARRSNNLECLLGVNFNIRLRNALLAAGIKTPDQLLSYSIDDLKKLRNIGDKSIASIITSLAPKGLHLKINVRNKQLYAQKYEWQAIKPATRTSKLKASVV